MCGALRKEEREHEVARPKKKKKEEVEGTSAAEALETAFEEPGFERVARVNRWATS